MTIRMGARLLLTAAVLLPALGGCAARWSPRVERALAEAGGNRDELERVLEYYEGQGDAEKLAAAEFLIANMPGHGYAVMALYDEDGNEIPYDCLDYANFNEALAALDESEKEHGTLEFKRRRFDADVEHITAEYLLHNIDLAFEAWRTRSWARNITFEAFCEHILPYRGSSEPIDAWRGPCTQRLAEVYARLGEESDLASAAKAVREAAGKWIGFDEIFYLHPTDQSYAEMCERRLGRCEDMTNMYGYAMRASAVLCASDYTPYWADRDNNHAWEVILDAEGRGKAGLFNRAAKVYRKTYSAQPDALGTVRRADEPVPRWLNGRNYRDVTAEYLETSDVTIELFVDPPAEARFAYLCVFNGGEWKAIHWGRIKSDRVTFTGMGRDIAYLPAYYSEGGLHPAAPPFILQKDGRIRPLMADAAHPIELEITATRPETPDADTRIAKPRIPVESGRTYELFVWRDGGWQSAGTKAAGAEPVSFEDVPSGGLYWLVAEGSRKLERIFTIDDGRQVFW